MGAPETPAVNSSRPPTQFNELLKKFYPLRQQNKATLTPNEQYRSMDISGRRREEEWNKLQEKPVINEIS